jgi:competence protein ComEA
VQQQSTPWRVFDAPATDAGPAAAPANGAGSPSSQGLALGSPRIALAGLAAALGVGALAIVLALGHSGDESVAGPGVSNAVPGSDAPEVAGSQIVVDVVGAVVRPGVYHLPSGSRVGDAITAAGGFGPRVDAGAVSAVLNLAATLKDGEQVRVPSRGDTTQLIGGGAGGTAGTGGAGGGASSDRLVNLNAATEAELDALPGIGPVTAGKIIEARAKAPFKTVDDLRSRGLVGQKTFDQIKALVTVG